MSKIDDRLLAEVVLRTAQCVWWIGELQKNLRMADLPGLAAKRVKCFSALGHVAHMLKEELYGEQKGVNHA